MAWSRSQRYGNRGANNDQGRSKYSSYLYYMRTIVRPDQRSAEVLYRLSSDGADGVQQGLGKKES